MHPRLKKIVFKDEIELKIGISQPGTDDVISGYQSEKSKKVADMGLN